MAWTMVESADAFDNLTDYAASGRYFDSGAGVVGVSAGVTGNAFTMGTNGTYAQWVFPASAITFYFGYHIKFLAFPSATSSFFQTRDNVANQASDLALEISNTGFLSIWRGGNVTLIATASAALTANKWFHINGFYTIANSGGRAQIWVNGTSVIDYTGDTSLETTPAGGTALRFITIGSGNTFYLDNIWVSDTTNYGQKSIGIYRPSADGNYSQFTTSTGSTHYVLVDEADVSGADYVKSVTAGHRDCYKFTEYSGSNAISAVAVNGVIQKDATDARTVKLFTRFSSTDDDGTAITPSVSSYITYQRVMPTNPITAVAWIPADLQGSSRAEFGIKIDA